MKCEKSN